MPTTVIVSADLIKSKSVFSQPGGYHEITDLCGRMRDVFRSILSPIAGITGMKMSEPEPKGDDVVFWLTDVDLPELADIAIAASIAALQEPQIGQRFRYTLFSLETDGAYHPRLREFGELSKTDAGGKYYLAIERRLISYVGPAVSTWLKSASHEQIQVTLKGESQTGAWFDLYCSFTDAGHLKRLSWKHRNLEFAEKTYLRYRTVSDSVVDSEELVSHLKKRYSCEAFRLGNRLFPVTILWKNSDRSVNPDSILGELDKSYPAQMEGSAVLGAAEYGQARAFIKRVYESGPIKYEGIDYRMTDIDLASEIPRIHGAYGWYYDAILTQYAVEWELRKAVSGTKREHLSRLGNSGSLPLREHIEAQCNPLLSGDGRCAALSISTFVVFQRRQRGFYCLLRRRSAEVGVSPRMVHVVPAGMFEAKNLEDPWSVEINIWRELLEEVYNDVEHLGTGVPEHEDYIRSKIPIALLLEMMARGAAELSVTGICFDLLNLRPEICTALFINDPAFVEAKRMELNWEYESSNVGGKFAVRLESIDEVIMEETKRGGFVVSGAACLGLGREWMRRRHGI